jgi:hypothetical protein
MGCPLCAGTDGRLLAAGSILTWIRCRDCGIDYHIPTEGFIVDEDEPTLADAAEHEYNAGLLTWPEASSTIETWPLTRRKE